MARTGREITTGLLSVCLLGACAGLLDIQERRLRQEPHEGGAGGAGGTSGVDLDGGDGGSGDPDAATIGGGGTGKGGTGVGGGAGGASGAGGTAVSTCRGSLDPACAACVCSRCDPGVASVCSQDDCGPIFQCIATRGCTDPARCEAADQCGGVPVPAGLELPTAIDCVNKICTADCRAAPACGADGSQCAIASTPTGKGVCAAGQCRECRGPGAAGDPDCTANAGGNLLCCTPQYTCVACGAGGATGAGGGGGTGCPAGAACPLPGGGSGICNLAGQCTGGSCTDNQTNGSESDVDCGGGTCPACAAGEGCAVSTDCQSLGCMGGVCQTPACTDGVKNGSETGTDCGGPCPACARCTPAGLVAYWPMDEAGGARADATGHGFTLDETNGTVGAASGHAGSAARFTATSLLTIPPARFNGSRLDVSGNQITVAGWMRFEGATGGQLIGHVRHCVASHYHLRVTGPADTVGPGAIETTVYPGTVTTSAGMVTMGAWHHYAVTFDAMMLRLYLDGVQIVAAVQSTPSIQNPAVGNVPLTVGGWIDTNGECSGTATNAALNGDIDDLVVYDRALVPAEIGTLMSQGPCALP